VRAGTVERFIDPARVADFRDHADTHRVDQLEPCAGHYSRRGLAHRNRRRAGATGEVAGSVRRRDRGSNVGGVAECATGFDKPAWTGGVPALAVETDQHGNIVQPGARVLMRAGGRRGAGEDSVQGRFGGGGDGSVERKADLPNVSPERDREAIRYRQLRGDAVADPLRCAGGVVGGGDGGGIGHGAGAAG